MAHTLSRPALVGRRQFSAMNTDVLLLTRDWQDPELLAEAEQIFRDVEERFSRFRPSSELVRLNTSAGLEVHVSREMFDLLSLCLAFHESFQAVFDPAILPSLESAGYDRSFELVAKAGGQGRRAPTRKSGSISDIKLDRGRSTVCCPPGLRLDLGGIAKGFAIDRAARVLAPSADFLIDVGGDIAVRGVGSDGGPGWLIAVADPFRPERDVCWLRLVDAAVATSTTMRRRWHRDGRSLHHIIDPRTGNPAATGLAQVTVVAQTAAAADVYAKTALILGIEAGAQWLAERSIPALLVTDRGGLLRSPRWERLETAMTRT
jgi:thiamine biosynthesis lipoprotein